MPRRLLAPSLAALVVLLSPAAAEAAADIEGVWSAGGGEIAVQASPDGTFHGTVVRPARFSDCVHPVGEEIWRAITPQPGGFYRGVHLWFAAGCRERSGSGLTAYRVLTNPDGSRTLRACFADPASATLAPAIAANGVATQYERPCVDFASVVATPATLRDITDLPSSKRCRSGRALTIGLRDPVGDALRSVVVTVEGKRTEARSGATALVVATPRAGRYSVKVRATTVLGRIIAGTRRYRACAGERP